MKPTLSQSQQPLQIVTQLLVANIVHEIHTVLLMRLVQFTPEEMASAGFTPEVLDQLQAILDELKRMANIKDEPESEPLPPS